MDNITQVSPHLRVVPPGFADQVATVADLAGTYARQADELAAMVETEARRSQRAQAVIAAALGELHTALDEIAAAAARGVL